MSAVERILFHSGVNRWINVDTGEIYNRKRGCKNEPCLGKNGTFEGGIWTKGSDHKTGKCVYKQVRIDGNNHLVHRLVGSFLPNPNGYKEYDHINRDPSDNRISNLLPCDRSSNLTNRQITDECVEKYGTRAFHTKECRSEYNKAYRAAHKEILAERNRIYRLAHRDELLQYGRKYREAHKDGKK